MNQTRRTFVRAGVITSVAMLTAVKGNADELQFGPWRDLFDGKTLTGWKAMPRLGVNRWLKTDEGKRLRKDQISEAVVRWHRGNGTPQAIMDHTGDWQVINGAIVGGQKPAGCRHGAYLVTQRQFGDVEVEYEIRPDWQTDTGILLRQHPSGALGFQVLCDHRTGGGIGGIFTNGLGGYLATPVVVDGEQDANFLVKNFRQRETDPQFMQGTVTDATTFDAFRDAWNLNDWNRFRVRCVGTEPLITVWINDLKIGTVDTSKPGLPDYDASQIQRLVGKEGHIGLEVHSNDAGNGWKQWSPGAVSRWRKIRVRELIE